MIRIFLLGLAAAAACVSAANAQTVPIDRGDCASQDQSCTCLALVFVPVRPEVRDGVVANSCAEEISVGFCQYSDRQREPDAKCDVAPIEASRREFFARIDDCNEIVRLFACTTANQAAGRCRIPERVVAVNGALRPGE